MGRRLSLILSLAALSLPVVALPHQAWAIACAGPLPHAGQTFSGVVRLVADGDRFCVSDQVDARTWILVRLSDFRAAPLTGPGGEAAKWALRRAARGKHVDCLAHHIAGNHVVAQCRIDGVSVGDLLRDPAGNHRADGSR